MWNADEFSSVNLRVNIKLNYLYRDAGNYKQYHQVVFVNKHTCSIDDINQRIQSMLIDKSWFVVSKWNLPDLRDRLSKYDSDLDHEWHEFESVTITTDAATFNIDILDFIDSLEKLG